MMPSSLQSTYSPARRLDLPAARARTFSATVIDILRLLSDRCDFHVYTSTKYDVRLVALIEEESLIRTTGQNATQTLAEYAAAIEYEALPATLVALIKQCVLDTLGVVIGATSLSSEARIVADYVMDL